MQFTIVPIHSKQMHVTWDSRTQLKQLSTYMEGHVLCSSCHTAVSGPLSALMPLASSSHQEPSSPGLPAPSPSHFFYSVPDSPASPAWESHHREWLAVRPTNPTVDGLSTVHCICFLCDNNRFLRGSCFLRNNCLLGGHRFLRG